MISVVKRTAECLSFLVLNSVSCEKRKKVTFGVILWLLVNTIQCNGRSYMDIRWDISFIVLLNLFIDVYKNTGVHHILIVYVKQTHSLTHKRICVCIPDIQIKKIKCTTYTT